jgi:hypothetical protein
MRLKTRRVETYETARAGGEPFGGLSRHGVQKIVCVRSGPVLMEHMTPRSRASVIVGDGLHERGQLPVADRFAIVALGVFGTAQVEHT